MEDQVVSAGLGSWTKTSMFLLQGLCNAAALPSQVSVGATRLEAGRVLFAAPATRYDPSEQRQAGPVSFFAGRSTHVTGSLRRSLLVLMCRASPPLFRCCARTSMQQRRRREREWGARGG
jgi:hypothetical protein